MEIYEILEQTAKLESRPEKATFLKSNDSVGLRDVLRGAFDDAIVMDLPKGSPQIENSLSNEGYSPTSLQRATKNFGYLVKGGPLGKDLPAVKKERIWLAILAGVHPKDAELLVAMKDKLFDGRYSGVDKGLVKEVWPKLLAK